MTEQDAQLFEQVDQQIDMEVQRWRQQQQRQQQSKKQSRGFEMQEISCPSAVIILTSIVPRSG
jgi:hypothetical protein